MDQSRSKGGRYKMETKTKPIRPSEYTFESDAELQQFINYAVSKEKSKSEGLDRMRKLLKNHTPSKERK